MVLADPEETSFRDFENFQEEYGLCGVCRVRVRVV